MGDLETKFESTLDTVQEMNNFNDELTDEVNILREDNAKLLEELEACKLELEVVKEENETQKEDILNMTETMNDTMHEIHEVHEEMVKENLLGDANDTYNTPEAQPEKPPADI